MNGLLRESLQFTAFMASLSPPARLVVASVRLAVAVEVLKGLILVPEVFGPRIK